MDTGSSAHQSISPSRATTSPPWYSYSYSYSYLVDTQHSLSHRYGRAHAHRAAIRAGNSARLKYNKPRLQHSCLARPGDSCRVVGFLNLPSAAAASDVLPPREFTIPLTIPTPGLYLAGFYDAGAGLWQTFSGTFSRQMALLLDAAGEPTKVKARALGSNDLGHRRVGVRRIHG